METSCKQEPDFSIERKISWAPDGKSILAWGFRTDNLKFGIVRWKTDKPFSTDEADYGPGKLEGDLSKDGRGPARRRRSRPTASRWPSSTWAATGGRSCC